MVPVSVKSYLMIYGLINTITLMFMLHFADL